MDSLNSTKTQSWLSWFLRGILILGMLILFSRTFELQVIKGSYYRNLSEENRIRRIPINAARGKIFARGGEVLVDNLAIKKAIRFNPKSGYEKSNDLTGVSNEELITEYLRQYPLAEKFGHASGYLGEVSPDYVGKIDPLCPQKGISQSGAFVGISGLEYQYNCVLQGIDGEELIEVDTSGKKIRTLGRKDPVPGSDIHTNIDYSLQIEVANNLTQKGAVVVTDPEGEVLALYSYPSYDPNLLTKKTDSDKVAALLKNPDLPFFNRAIGGLFHPGSVFKPLVALTALEEGKVDKNFTFNDEGQLVVKTLYGDFSYSNWYFTQYGRTEGEIGLVKAISRSTDTFFYTIGALVGPEK
ncbi:MAG: penicillin-binding transpeptidase domain-containing protein, partial [Microgenomates group bacterium]